MKNYTLVVQNTTDKRYFTTGITDQEDSKIYYHVESFSFPDGFSDGEYRYYVLPETDKEVTADNDHIYFDGEEVEAIATGLMVLGKYQNPSHQYNVKREFIQYE